MARQARKPRRKTPAKKVPTKNATTSAAPAEAGALPASIQPFISFAEKLHGPASVRLLRKTLDLRTKGEIDEEVVDAAQNADQAVLIGSYCALVLRRAAFMPTSQKDFTQNAEELIGLIWTNAYEVMRETSEIAQPTSGSEAVGEQKPAANDEGADSK